MGEETMKTCPVCGAECFGDMETCFSCLHAFDVQEGRRPDAFVFGSPADCGIPAADEPFVPEEAVVPALPALQAGVVAPASCADAAADAGTAQLRIVIDLQGFAPLFAQKS